MRPGLDRFGILLVLGILCCLGGTRSVHADNIRPAYLEIEETGSAGAIRVVWKLPLNQAGMSELRPALPEHCRVSSPTQRYKASDAVVQSWDMVCGDNGLAGALVGIDGLEQTVSDAMLRVRLADGTLHRVVLRPTENSTRIPDPESAAEAMEADDASWLRLLDRWRYALLLPVAWLLSLTPAARRRGIALCTAALVVGGLGGHALGMYLPRDGLLQQKLPSDAQASRILQGLMLNTYRAFMLEDDEAVYEVLARGVVGELLQQVYLENREVMRMDTEEGALSVVDRLDVRSIESMKRLKGGGIAMVASWDVYGSVLHWGHVHYRCNSYRAELTLVPTDDYWKLAGLELLDQRRVI